MGQTAILVPLDGSGHATAALPYAKALARVTGASLRLLAVVARMDGRPGGSVNDVRTYVEQTRRAALTQHLAEVAAAIRDQGFTVATHLAYGDPSDEILADADAAGVAMTVLATHGRSATGRMFLGSVADKVMRLSARPTVLIRPHQEKGEAAPVKVERVMVPLDGSQLAESVLPLAVDLATAAGATLCIVRVEPYVTAEATAYDTAAAEFAALDSQLEAAAREYLEQVRVRLPRDLAVETAVLRGFPALSLIEFGAERNVDLVVMATHGRGGVRRLVLGSTAERLVRAGVPVLLMRPSGQTGGTQDPADLALHCAACGRLILALPEPDTRCPRCGAHLHGCANCIFWDTTGCVLQRSESYIPVWPGRDCPRFSYRATPAQEGTPVLVELENVD